MFVYLTHMNAFRKIILDEHFQKIIILQKLFNLVTITDISYYMTLKFVFKLILRTISIQYI